MSKDRRTDNQRKTDAVINRQQPQQAAKPSSDRPKVPTVREVLFGRRK